MGLWPVKNVPAAWPESLKRSWRVEIGEGYSSPVVAARPRFCSYTARSGRDRHRHQSRRRQGPLGAEVPGPIQKEPVRRRNGERAKLDSTRHRRSPDSHSESPEFSTPGTPPPANCFGPETFQNRSTRRKLFCGTAASPLLVDGRLVVQVGSDIHGGQILGLNPKTGATEWEWKGLGPGYASPVVIEAGGQRQIVTMTQGSIVGIEAKNGKELWSVPFPDEWNENISTPLWTGAHLIVSGTRQGTHAYTLTQAGGKWQATESWKNPDVAMYMSSPVFGDGLIYGHSSKKKGQFVAMDAKTGAVRWATEGREGEHASLLLTPQHVIFLTNGADLIVAKRGAPAFAVERRYEVAEAATWAMPVLLGSNILVRDATGLMLLTAGK